MINIARVAVGGRNFESYGEVRSFEAVSAVVTLPESEIEYRILA
jgi:hypothetical protein